MQSINTIKINNIELEYTKKNDTSYYIYNTSNNRTIVGNEEVINYLKSNSDIDEDSPLFDFIFNSPKKSILDFNLISLELKNKSITNISSFAKLTTNSIVCYLSILLIIYFIATSSSLLNFQLKNYQSIPLYLLTVYLCGFIIILFHEFSHFYYYTKYFNTNKSKFGLTLRYFFMLLVFVNVPFMDVMKVKWQKKMILAGIKTQITISGILSLTAILFPYIANNMYFQIPFFLNIGLIMINLLPFFKLDGFWYISSILGVSNYMVYFKNMLLRKVKFNFFILIIGILNILLIILFIMFSIYRIYSFVFSL